MAADSVEREILIEATAEVVWGVITEPEQISRWFSDEADLEGRTGADGTLTWRARRPRRRRGRRHESCRSESWRPNRSAASASAGTTRRAQHRMSATRRWSSSA